MNYKIIFISFILLFFILGAASANDLNSTDTLGGDVKEIYVNTTGNDLNTGSSDSPYATIGKAIGDVNASDDATIYIGKGTFSGENDGDFSIDLNHKVYGGNLKFIGAGANETILDGQSSFRFASIGQNSNITFINLTFINFKAENGATLYSEGILTVDNCVFRDSYATGTNGGAIYSHGENSSELYITNSKFISCSANGNPSEHHEYDGGGAICTENINYVYLENNSFINTRVNGKLKGFAVNIHSTTLNIEEHVSIYTTSYIKGNKFINITSNEMSFDAGLYVFSVGAYSLNQSINKKFILNNEFVNCYNPSEEYAVVYLKTSKDYFENNTFINSTNKNGNIFLGADTTIYGLQFNLTNELNNITNHEINDGIDLLLNITDDNGNIVKLSDFIIEIYINLISDYHTYSYLSNINGDMLHVNFNPVPEYGNYSMTATFCGDDYYLTEISVIHDNAPFELWVSPNGFDGNEGTKESPFESIEHAIDVGFDKSFNVLVHLLEGTYTGEGNIELTISNKGYLQIIGENKNNVIIDGQNSHWFVKSDTNVTIKNVKFINGYSNARDLITTREYINGFSNSKGYLFLDNCIIDRCKVDGYYIANRDSYNILSGGSFYNLTYTNNIGQISTSEVINSYFENNTNPQFGPVIKEVSKIANSSFINNSAYTGAIISGSHRIISSNSYYVNNRGNNSGVFSMGYQSKFTSYNDTFVNNSAVNYGVIGFSLDNANNDPTLPNFEIVNATFVNNHAQKSGTLIMQKGTIINSSFINNSAEDGGAIVIIRTNQRGASYNMIRFENLTFEGNGNDVYLSMDIDSHWYLNQKLYFALPLNITFNDLTTQNLPDELTATVYGPCGAHIGGNKLNFKIDNVDVGYSEIVNGNAMLKYYGFENGEFNLSGDVDNMYKSTVNNGVITVNLANYVSNREVWVSNSGSDVNGDGSKSNPYKTIGHAIDESTKNCINVIIHLEGGTYTGELNTALEVSSSLNLTLKGEDGAVIDGENNTWFLKVLRGNNKITISDLTVRNMGEDNRESRVINSISPITVDEGAELYLNNVIITNNHGGEAIIKNNGNLIIKDSLITKNGFSTKALVYGGHVNINATSMTDNFGVESSFDCEDLIINNSLIKNSFNLNSKRVSGGVTLIEGDSVLVNTIILNDGDNSSLNLLGIDEVNSSILPGLSLDGNVSMKNVSIINKYSSPVNISQSTRLSVFGYNLFWGHGIKNVNASDCSFYNFNYLWLSYNNGDSKFNFNRCLFNNISVIFSIGSLGENSYWIFNNSVFLNVGLDIYRPRYYDPAYTTSSYHISHDSGPNTVPYDNNFWASNSQPVIRYFDNLLGNRTIFNYSPHNWIVLNNVNGILKLQWTNGVNTTDYTGDLPLKVSYALNDGEFVPVITVDGKSYPLIFEGENFRVDSNPIENPILKEIVNNTLFSNDLTLKYGDELNFTARFLCPWGDPLANNDVIFSINDRNYTVRTDENGSATLSVALNAGVYDILIFNPVSKQVNVNAIVVNKIKPKITAANVNSVYNDGKYLTINVNAPGTVNVLINGKTITKTVDSKGQVKIPIALAPKTYTATITYHGNVNYAKASTTATIKVTKATPKMTAKKATLKNKKYTITLKDNRNKAMKKVKVTLKVKGKTYKATTNKKGKATFKITKLTKRGKYTAKVKFAGNKNFKAVTKTVKLTVKK